VVQVTRLTGPSAARLTAAGLAAGLAVVSLAACSTATPRPRAGTSAAPSTSASPTGTASPVDDAWRTTGHGGMIEGYAGADSVLPGERVRVYVSTTAARFTIRAFRMGWYGGDEGRLIATSATLTGRRQPPPVVLGPRRTVEARWSPSATLDTTGWPAGVYLLRLEASSGAQSFIPLTLRSPSARGAVVLVTPDLTWQAYNLWGCCDLYAGADGRFATRSRAVSFDRPYAHQNGAGEFITRELPVVAQAERLGLRLAYLTDVDIALRPHVLDGATAVIFMGHDEYWSPSMRSAVTAARDHGTNLAFLGANAVFRRIRLEPSPLGPGRVVVNYKIASEDPLNGVDNAAVTSDWPAPPDPQPEQSLVGAAYNCFTSTRSAGVVVDPSNFLFAGTGVTTGTNLPGVVGQEIDHAIAGALTPRPLEVLMHSPFPCPGGRSYSDATYYSAPSGAGVFDSGTMSWVVSMTSSNALTRRVMLKATDNLLLAFSRGPCGRAHPARDNLARFAGR
jgi:hypothetical protein